MRSWLLLVSSLFLSNVLLSTAAQCGEQNQGLPCPDGLCCSEYGWCGTTDDYCLVENGCQMNCTDGTDAPPSTSPPPPSTAQCGMQNQGLPCPDGLCCSGFGWCGTTDDYCLVENGCQMNCTDGPDAPPSPSPPPPGPIDGGALGEIISREMFEEMFPFRNDYRCKAVNFYTYEAFINAAKSFPDFAATGDEETRKREVAAFLGQTSHETTGGTGWEADIGPDYWGYCWNKEDGCPSDYCDYKTVLQYPCVSGQRYCGRGPIQLTWNTNYGQYGESIGLKDQLLQDPDMLIRNATMAFEAAYWFWMTTQPPKPSCHDVITGAWTPSGEDIQAGRLPGYGMITNIINGGLECGHGSDYRVEDRILYYERYTKMLGISPGDNLDCYNMEHYPNALVQSM